MLNFSYIVLMSGKHTNCVKYQNYAGKSTTTLILEILWMGNYSRSQLADILGVNKDTLARWMTHGRRVFRPSSSMIPQIISLHRREFHALKDSMDGYYNGIKVSSNNDTEHVKR